MKSREEIEQLANDYWEGCDGCDANDKYFFIKGFVCAYIQLQEGIGDKKYTEEDIRKVIDETIKACNISQKESYGDLEIDTDKIINSLNKQD